MITDLSPAHLDTPEGVTRALHTLAAAGHQRHLPAPVDAPHPVPRMGRVDVHLADDDALAAWAAAFRLVIVDHDPVHEAHLLLGGHHFDLWTLAAPTATGTVTS